ncbi:MAG TPA: efflux RND transporter permease subunit, partial [Bdellovibrio sp.]|nr:efflux RND transporter permease subunit [Bdellovibrio sp.]
MRKVLETWIGFQRNQPVLFWFLFVLFISYGTWIAMQSEIEAFPEFTNVQVQVITQYPGKASEEVERQVTQPLEVATNGLPGLINQRSISIFGLSVITLTFDDNVKSKDARLDLSQHLGDANLPDGVKPGLSSDSTPVGEIFRYTLTGSAPVDEQRLTEDWTLEREFKSIPGVADVVSFGGPTKTLEVRLDVTRMKALGLSITNVAQALGQNHANAGGTIITHGEEGYIVRSIGMYETPQSLESAVVATQKGVPIRVRDIGSVQVSHRPRLGLVSHNQDE